MGLEWNRGVDLLMCERKVLHAATSDFSEVVEMHLQAMLDYIARHVGIDVIRFYGGD